jgi:hypothetical protein
MRTQSVYFTLKDSSPDAVRALVADCHASLSGHPGIRFFGAGTRSPDLVSPANDLDFHVALQVVFEDEASHRDYQVSTEHLEFIARNRGNWAAARIFNADID